MAGNLGTGNERHRRSAKGDDGNVHDMFYVRNMFWILEK